MLCCCVIKLLHEAVCLMKLFDEAEVDAEARGEDVRDLVHFGSREECSADLLRKGLEGTVN